MGNTGITELKNYQLLPKDSNTDEWNGLPSNKDSRSLEILAYLKGTEDYE